MGTAHAKLLTLRTYFWWPPRLLDSPGLNVMLVSGLFSRVSTEADFMLVSGLFFSGDQAPHNETAVALNSGNRIRMIMATR
jgi:hypothetical protein